MSSRLRQHRDVFLIIIGSLILRVAAIPFVHSSGFTSDEKEYVSMANNLAAGKSFVDSNGERSTRAPLFPFLLSALFMATARGAVYGEILDCILGAGLSGLAFALAYRLFRDRKVALVAAAAAALYPGLIIFSTLLQNEILYTVLLLVALALTYRLVDGGNLWFAVLLGMVAGLASLTRAIFVGFVPLLVAVIVWMRAKQGMSSFLYALTILALWILVLAPWTLRNYELYGRIVPVSSGGGNSLLTGNNPYATGTWRTQEGFEQWHDAQLHRMGVDNAENLSEVDLSALNGRIALEFIASHPLFALKLAVRKAYVFWIYPITNTDSNTPIQAVAVAADALLLLGFVWGLTATWHQRQRLLPIYAALLFFFPAQIVLHSEARFRLPLVPLMCIVFGAVVALIPDRARRHEFLARHKLAVGTLTALVVLIYSLTGYLFLAGAI